MSAPAEQEALETRCDRCGTTPVVVYADAICSTGHVPLCGGCASLHERELRDDLAVSR